MTPPEFTPFPKMARLSREVVITEKIDGTNAQIFITDEGEMFTGSRSRWITPAQDNFGFARWAMENKEELMKLGPGKHFGEWWGSGIQRGYNLPKGEKRFSLFNAQRWYEAWSTFAGDPPEKMLAAPMCCHVVPVLHQGIFSTENVSTQIERLKTFGSLASPGFMKPEGIVIYHIAGNVGFKKTIEKDEVPKSQA